MGEPIQPSSLRIPYGSLQTSLPSSSSNAAIGCPVYEHPTPLPPNHINPFVTTPPFSTERAGIRPFHKMPLAETLVDSYPAFRVEEGFVRYPIRSYHIRDPIRGYQIRELLVDTPWEEERNNSRKVSSSTRATNSPLSSFEWSSPIPRSGSQAQPVFGISSLNDRCIEPVEMQNTMKVCDSHNKSSLGSWTENDELGLEGISADVANISHRVSSRTSPFLHLTSTIAPEKSIFGDRTVGDRVAKVGEQLYRHTVHGSLESVKGFTSDEFYERVNNHPIRRGQHVHAIEHKLACSTPDDFSKRYQRTQRFVEPSLLPTSSAPVALPFGSSPLSSRMQLPPPELYTPSVHYNTSEGPKDLEMSILALPKALRNSRKRTSLNQHQLENIIVPENGTIVTLTPNVPDWKSHTSAGTMLVTKYTISAQEQKRNRHISTLGCLFAAFTCCLLPAYGWGGLDPFMEWISNGKCREFDKHDKFWAKITTCLIVVLGLCGLIIFLVRLFCY